MKPKKGEEEVFLSPETKALLESRASGCFLCRFILEDQERNGRLTGYPVDYNGAAIFPVGAKVAHISLEKGPRVSPSPAEPGMARRDG